MINPEIRRHAPVKLERSSPPDDAPVDGVTMGPTLVTPRTPPVGGTVPLVVASVEACTAGHAAVTTVDAVIVAVAVTFAAV